MGVSLSEDEQALIDLVVSATNSSHIHTVEYHNLSDDISIECTNA